MVMSILPFDVCCSTIILKFVSKAKMIYIVCW